MTHVLRLSALGTRLDVHCTGERADLLATSMRVAWSRCIVDGDEAAPTKAAAPVELTSTIRATWLAGSC